MVRRNSGIPRLPPAAAAAAAIPSSVRKLNCSRFFRSQNKRQPIVDRFQAEPKLSVILLAITAAGVGITLTSSSCAVFAELYWTPGSMAQAEDRIHRLSSVFERIVMMTMMIVTPPDLYFGPRLFSRLSIKAISKSSMIPFLWTSSSNAFPKTLLSFPAVSDALRKSTPAIKLGTRRQRES